MEPAQKFGNLLPWVLVVLFGLFGVVIFFGLFDNRLAALQQRVLPRQRQISEAELPIGTELLKHPIVYQWRGSIRGTLIAKTEKSITIEDDNGNRLNIPLGITPGRPPVTLFFDVQIAGTPVPLEKVEVGSRLVGDFFVIPGNKNQIVGGSFTVLK